MLKGFRNLICVMHDLLYTQPYVKLETRDMGPSIYGMSEAKHFNQARKKLYFRNKFLD